MTAYHDNNEQAAKNVIAAVGKNIVIGLPLALGKPVGFINALYKMAVADSSIKLTIITALTLARPPLHNELERRFITPFLDRVLGDYEELLYEGPRVKQQLPPNINVVEFFLSTAKFLHNAYVQQNYISSSYTDVSRDVFQFGINVIGQMVSHSSDNKNHYSLSCNSDLFPDVVRGLKASGKKYAIIAEVNNKLPFMLGDAVLDAETFTDVIDTGHYPTLFSIPHDELSIKDQLIGLYTSTLIKDDSCLQIGIGKLSNALTSSLLLRQKENKLYQDLLNRLQVKEKFAKTIAEWGDIKPFEKGLYASTEMLCDGYLHLYKENILKKNVYDHLGLQTLLSKGEISETVSADMLKQLRTANVISDPLTQDDISFLIKFGIFTEDKKLRDGQQLKNGIIIHAGFFLGSMDMYADLVNMPLPDRQKINMTAVARTNSMMWWPDLLKLQRKDARFVNSSMMVTLGGVIISDGLSNLQEISGVGGQFDFVVMATELPGSRSIINCHSTRKSQGKVTSNVLWEYSNITIPRFLRDVVVTEYGIADCRSKTDSEVIKAILNVSDSRFQDELLKTAKRHHKIAADYEIPPEFRRNLPQVVGPIIEEYQAKGYFKPYPFGTELTDVEISLKNILLKLAALPKWKALVTAAAAFLYFANDAAFEPYLRRMQLLKPKTFSEYFYKRLLKYRLRKIV